MFTLIIHILFIYLLPWLFTVAWKWQKPCLALVPSVNTPYHQVCESLKRQIVNVIKEIDNL